MRRCAVPQPCRNRRTSGTKWPATSQPPQTSILASCSDQGLVASPGGNGFSRRKLFAHGRRLAACLCTRFRAGRKRQLEWSFLGAAPVFPATSKPLLDPHMNLFGRIQATCVVSRSTGMLSLLARWFAILETTPVVQLAEPCVVTMNTAPRSSPSSTRRRWLADNSTQQRMQQDAVGLGHACGRGQKADSRTACLLHGASSWLRLAMPREKPHFIGR